jgi:hypothetical protein
MSKSLSLKDSNTQRYRALNLYLKIEQLDEADSELVKREILETGKADDIFYRAYELLMSLGMANIKASKTLQKEFELSPLAAIYVINKVQGETTATLNIAEWYTSTLHTANHLVSKSLEILKSAEEFGEEVDPIALMSEARAALELQHKIVSKGLDCNLVQLQLDNKNKVIDKLETLSLDELRTMQQKLLSDSLEG